MAEIFHRRFFLKGTAGRLEATLWTRPESARARLATVVCHPHPLYGGTLHNKVVYQVAKTLHRLGLPVLRFNFRGAGMSEGQHNEGRGERDDVRAAIDFLAETFSGAPILLAGFSFGASVGLRVGCGDERVTELVGLGLPADNFDLSFLETCGKPKLFVQGGQDQFGSQENVRKLMEKLPGPKRLVIVDGADHFFAGRLDRVGDAVNKWMNERHPELESARGAA
ncbi:MAG: alpha/beta hydrolase [Acidobacteria bacterium]|nr:alpha/beta hydrolase [Acidobacteriota bacterium]MBI3664445.1 alpha/beta hydrolase [Acidobacteriota bacterium]